MAKVVKAGSTKKLRFQYSPSKVNLALNAISEGMPVAKASRVFKVPRTTLRNKISGISPRQSTGHCGFDSYLGRDIEDLLVNWILDCAKMGFPIDKDGLLTSVQKLVKQRNIQAPFLNGRPGKKWYHAFLSRHKELSKKKAEYIHGGRGAVTEEKIRKWFDEVHEILSQKGEADILKDPNRIFNMDETGFSLAPKTGVIIGPRGKHVYDERTSSDKENVTTLFTVNGSGNFGPPLTVFKYERIPSAIAKSAPGGWGLGKSENGWMTAEVFFEYFSNVFVPYVKKVGIAFPIIVFLDGHRSHMTLHLSRFCRENQIILVALVPNATHILQPLDIAVFGPMKNKWKLIVRKYKVENQGQEITKLQIPAELSQIINDPSMKSNIISGFKSTGLYPFSADNVDYDKIILRKNSLEQKPKVNPAVAEHLKYLESKIDFELLDQFNLTKRRNHEWEGKPEASYLYNIWLEMSRETESLTKSMPDTIDANKESVQPIPDIMDQDADGNNEEPPRFSTPTQFENVDSPDPIPLILDQASYIPGPSRIKSLHTHSLTLSEQVESLINNNNDTIADTPRSKKIESVKLNITNTPTGSLSSAFHDILPWPEATAKKFKRRIKEYIPSVVTSDKWVEYYEEKERMKKEQEQNKQERKQAQELRKQHKKNLKIKKKSKNKKKRLLESSSSGEDWVESGSSLDDVDFDTAEVEMFAVKDLKPGDFVLAQFQASGKRVATTYRYVSTILEVVSPKEFKIQCLKSLNQEKTSFDYIENDISIINKNNIITQLPEPVLQQDGRKLKTTFSAPVNVVEKN